ncbi:hypothetical protein DSECCO2_626810 [anaerobic digester metagenome]
MINVDVLQNGPDRYFLLTGMNGDFMQRCVADSACRIIHDAVECFVVVRINDNAEIRNQVFHFLTLVKRHSAIHTIRDIEFSQCIFHSTRLCIGAVKHGEIAVVQMIGHPCVKDGIRHQQRFVNIVRCLDERNRLPFIISGPHHFVQLRLIVLNNRIGGSYNGFGGTIILLKFECFL